MAIESTNLMQEVTRIVEEGATQAHQLYAIAVRANNEWISPIILDSLTLQRDYETNYADVVVVTAQFPLGDYAYGIVPYRDDLWVDLVSTPVTEHGGNLREDIPIRRKRFRAILMGNDNPAIDNPTPQSSSREDLNRTGMYGVELQLIEESVYQIRMMTVGRTYRNVIPMDALRALLTETTGLLNVKQQQHIFGVDVAGKYVTDKRSVIDIEDGTPLTKVHRILQEQEGGLYSTGVGRYLQDGLWYVYSLYDPTRVRENPETLTIIRVPPNRYAGAERTYRVTDNQVVIIAAGVVKQEDDGLTKQLNEGSGFRVSNARKLLTPTENSDNKALSRRQENVYEFKGEDMSGGMVNAQWAAERATSNPHKHYSNIARRQGRYLYIEWTHGDPTVLYPGMPVIYYDAMDDGTERRNGVLLGLNRENLPNKAGVTPDSFPATIMLKVFITRSHQI